MTDEQINIAIAEACGWTDILKRIEEHVDLDSRTITHITGVSGYPKGWDNLNYLPNYVNDLNAMQEAWESLTPSQKVIYEDYLQDVVVGMAEYHRNDDAPYITNATARQRAKAFLHMNGKWEEVQP